MSDSNRGQSPVAVVALLLVVLACGGGLIAWYQSRLVAQRQLAVVALKEAEKQVQLAEAQAKAKASHSISAPTTGSLPPLQLARTTPLTATDQSNTTETAESPEAIIKRLLSEQQTAWNAGDLESFMKVYWHSDQLTFCSSGKTTRGWQATLDNYKAKYSTKEKLGKLTFDQLEFLPLSDTIMLVLGRWHLERGPDSIGGNYSLVWQKIDGQWVIIHDHSSAEPPK